LDIWCRDPFGTANQFEWVAQTRELLVKNPDCFHRTSSDGHVTASGVVVNLDFTEVLLTHHHVLHRWLQLGGHVDGSPDIPAAARREVEEEASITDPTFFDYWSRLGLDSDVPLFYDLDIHRI